MAKHPGWRPTKLTQNLLDKFQEVLDEKQNALLCTDEELLMLLNEKIEDEKDRVSEDSFQRYKAWTLDSNKELVAKFCGLYQKALLKQRDDLFERMKWDTQARQRRAWIIERKFDNWNIRHKQEMSGQNGWPIKTENKIMVEIVHGNNIDK